MTNFYKAIIGIFLAEICWGLMAPIGKLAMQAGMSALTLAFLRMLGGALCFWIVALFLAPKQKIKNKDYILLAIAGIMSISLNQGAYILGVSYTSPVNATIISCTMPIWTMIFAYFLLKSAINLKKILGIILGIVGATILIMTGVSNSSSGSVIGDVICLLSQLSVALYLIIFKNFVTKYHTLNLMKWMFLFATISFLPFSLVDFWSDIHASFSFTVWSEAFFVVFFATFIAYLFFMYAQKNLEPQVCSMFNYLLPVVAMAVSIALGLDVFSWVKVLATVMIFLGVYIVILSNKKKTNLKN